MTFDLYSVDGIPNDSGNTNRTAENFVIQLVADADPDVLHRVSAQLNILNEAPTRVLFERRADETATMTILIRCTARAADLVYRKLEQLTSVISVSVSANKAEREPVSCDSATDERQSMPPHR